MSNVWGSNLKLTIFGESHGPAIGMTLGGLPAGLLIDWDAVRIEMARRAPGSSDLTTPRVEKDEWELLSGVFEGKTTGAPLTAIIRNENTRSRDYTPHLLRPGHADYTALVKYGGHTDYRGGGHFSGRLTAGVTLAGALAKQLLREEGIQIGARILQIHNIRDSAAAPNELPAISRKPFPVKDDGAGERMKQAVLHAKEEGDSVGGVVECAALGLSAGLGEPFFDSVESALSSLLFSIPAVKAVEFGDGFALSAMRGSESNDPLEVRDGKITFTTNRNGGLNGGITNGMPLLFRVGIKPTSSISKPQTTVNTETMQTVRTSFGGRHDPCIVPRALPVVEAATAICLLDFMLKEKRN